MVLKPPAPQPDNYTVEKQFTYRNGCLFFFAFWFGVGGLIFFGISAFQTLSGHPPPMNGRVPLPNSLEAWIPAILALIPITIGVGVFLFAKNSRVVLNDQGVTVIDWLGKAAFSAKWEDITSVHRRYDNQSNYNLQIEAGKRSTVITSSIIGMADLEEALTNRLGPLDPSTTDTGLRIQKLHPDL